MKIALIAFTEQGKALADRLALSLGGEAVRCGGDAALGPWTAKQFAAADGLIFVGAAGIAVRAIAPHVQSKGKDPAVVVVDECGTYAVPILSGHLGGANALARRVAEACGAQAVITTATDRNGVFPVDEWARVQGCAVPFPKRIKAVSARLLAGETIRVFSPWPVEGSVPAGVEPAEPGTPCDVRLTVRREESDALLLVPRILVLGVGCRRGTPAERIESFFVRFMERNGFREEAVCLVCSIDLKAEERGILAFCEGRGLPFATYPAETLALLEGDFASSDYVRQVTGVDNVCERSAAAGSGGGKLLCRREAGDGITMALAERPFRPDWRYA